MIAVCINISYLLSTIVYPYMPNVSAAIRKQLNLPVFEVLSESPNAQDYDSENIKPCNYQSPVFFSTFQNFVKEGHLIGKAEPLFKRIGDTEVKEWKQKFGGVQEVKEVKPKGKNAKKTANVKSTSTSQEPVLPN